MRPAVGPGSPSRRRSQIRCGAATGYNAGVLASLLAAVALAAADPGYEFARALAEAGPRPAASAAELAAHRQARARFKAAGLRVAQDTFTVPGKGRSRNVIGIVPGAARCLTVVMAHTDSTATTPGALDNASGVGVLVALAPRLRGVRCETWLVATGAEERIYTGRPDHLGALALVQRVRRPGTPPLRFALSLDEVGRGRRFELKSSAAAPRAGVERVVLAADRAAGLRVGFARDAGTGNSDHREFQLAGLPAMKLGVPANPCRHAPCDTADKLQPAAFPRVRRLVEAVLR